MQNTNKKNLRIDLLTVWKKPNDYCGFSPDGDYLIYNRNRNSSILENSNYEQILRELQNIDSNNTYDFRVNHFAYGWVEYILIKKNSSNELIEKAIDITAGLSNYLVYDDEDYSEKQNDAINEYWDNNFTLKEKIELCKKYNISIFAARCNNVWDISNDWDVSNDIYNEIEAYIN